MNDLAPSIKHRLLVIGYGNQARRDDGIGPYVAARVKAPGVEAVESHQLFPDMVIDLCESGQVVFVDAGCEPIPRGWRVDRVKPAGWRPYGTHSLEPGDLLTMADELYGRKVKAWLLTVQGDDFSLGFELSPEASARADRVLDWLNGFIRKTERRTHHRSRRYFRPNPLGGAHAA